MQIIPCNFSEFVDFEMRNFMYEGFLWWKDIVQEERIISDKEMNLLNVIRT